MTPAELLRAAEKLLTEPWPSMQQCWQRSCAGLTRGAVEIALDGYWQRVAPSLSGRPMRHQLIALRCYADRAVANEASAVWNGLSRAMHHHAYELRPLSVSYATGIAARHGS